jgi:hypothetical protein
MEPNGSRRIDTVTAGYLLKDELSRASHESGTEQYRNVPPHAGMFGCVQYACT